MHGMWAQFGHIGLRGQLLVLLQKALYQLRCTVRPGNTTKILAKQLHRMLKYRRILKTFIVLWLQCASVTRAKAASPRQCRLQQ